MVAVTIQGIASNERAGPFHFFCGLCFLRPPPPTFSECRNISSLLRMRKIVHYVSHTMRYDCIFARCLLPRKRSCDVPIWVGKKDGAPLLCVKLSFPRLADGFNFNLRNVFTLMSRKIWRKIRLWRTSICECRAISFACCCLALLFLLYVEGRLLGK